MLSADSPEQLRLRLHPDRRDIRISLKVEQAADEEYGSVTLDNSNDRNSCHNGPGYPIARSEQHCRHSPTGPP